MDVEFPKINNKLAFFGYSQTLVCHMYPVGYTKAADYFTDCTRFLTAPANEYTTDMPLPCMQWYAKELFDEGYGLYCLSCGASSLRDQFKKERLSAYYPDTPMTYVSVDIRKHKVDMMKAIAAAECCSPSDVIFVDSNMETVYEALAAGMDAKHVSVIAAIYESRKRPSIQQDAYIKPQGMDGPFADAGFLDRELTKTYEECRKIAEQDLGRGGNI